MSPDYRMGKQRGAGLPIALFIITALALMVAGMSQLQESASTAMSLQIQSQKAFFAAESGAQAGVAEVLASDSCGTVPATITFTAGGLSGCQAALTCVSVSADIKGSSAPETFYTLTSEGQCGVGVDYAERTLEVRVQ